MKFIGIISAMNIEMKLLKDSMTILYEQEYAGFKFYSAIYKDLNIVLTSCGIGKVNAASCTQILIDKFNITTIINTGIAGSLNKNVKLCDVVISSDATYHDVRKAQMKNCFPYMEFFIANEQLIKIAVKAYQNLSVKNYNYHVGRVVTGDYFISNDNLKESIQKEYMPYCVEMEGAAIGHVSYINKVPFIIIRSISDNANGKVNLEYPKFEKLAASNSSMLVLKMLDLQKDI